MEIGSGWGGMAMYNRPKAPVPTLPGITLSEEQLRVSRDRAAKRGLAGNVRFEMPDYRYLPASKKYDRIVSVGMFEHVGPTHYRDYFDKVAEVLDDKEHHGAALHRPALSGTGDQPLHRKIHLPRGYIPSLAEVLPALEKARCW